MKPIFLVGFMGCGKTTLGKALAPELGCTFIDLDIHIETRYHRTVKQLFAERGEDAFREIERNVLREIGEFNDVIVGCGGGTPCFYSNMEYMNSVGTTVYLEASVDCLLERLSIPTAKSRRPILADKTSQEMRQFIADTLNLREKWYRQAHIKFNAEQLDNIEEIKLTAQSLASKIKE